MLLTKSGTMYIALRRNTRIATGTLRFERACARNTENTSTTYQYNVCLTGRSPISADLPMKSTARR